MLCVSQPVVKVMELTILFKMAAVNGTFWYENILQSCLRQYLIVISRLQFIEQKSKTIITPLQLVFSETLKKNLMS